MSNPLQQAIEAIAKEEGIEPESVISAIEEAVATASSKYYKTGENLKTRFNTETGQVDLFALKTVVEEVTNAATEISINEAREMYRPLYGDEVANSIELGDEMEFPKPTEVLGRIAAQTAKQVIFQKVRGAVREAGDRAKVAVYSRERDVDPVGACVGMKGTRVQSIIRELRGEKIDIVEWSEDSIAFVTNALSPAKVQRVSIVDDRERVMEVIVEDKQLSPAIGKKGQNVRLAAKLTGWRIDIKSEEEKRREVEAQFEGLELGASSEAAEPASPDENATPETGTEPATDAPASDVPAPYTLAGAGEKMVRKTVEGGFATANAGARDTLDQPTENPRIRGKTAEKILAAARGEAPKTKNAPAPGSNVETQE